MEHQRERYKVRVTKDYLTFCAGHFIIFDGDQCERLHGHNYRVAAEIESDLNEDFLVFDFIALKRILRAITDELDHRMLVPLHSGKLAVEVKERSVRLTHCDKEWIFPREDCALLPVENTTAELLARWVAERLRQELAAHAAAHTGRAVSPNVLRVEVEETSGQAAHFEITVGPGSGPGGAAATHSRSADPLHHPG